MTPKRIIEVAESQLEHLAAELATIKACAERAYLYLEAARGNIEHAKWIHEEAL